MFYVFIGKSDNPDPSPFKKFLYTFSFAVYTELPTVKMHPHCNQGYLCILQLPDS